MKNILTILFFACSLTGFANKIYPSKGGDGGYFSGTSPNPGDTAVLRHSDGDRSYFAIDGWRGTAQRPIVIINEGGQVRFSLGFDIKHCQYLKIDGSGDAGTTYGFLATGELGTTSGVPFSIQGRSKNIEVNRVKVYKKLYGLWAKTDASCVDSTNYPNWIMDSIHVHHSDFQNIGQDCIYAGNTSPNGQVFNCGAGNVTKYPHRLAHFEMDHCIIDSCNRTGFQLSECMGGSVHDNTITRCGYEYNQSQGTGITIGGHSYGIWVYNNIIDYTFLYSILDLGKGENFIFNNLVRHSGFLRIDTALSDIDSIAKKMDTTIFNNNPATGWNSGNKHIKYSNDTLFNVFSQPCNILGQPDNDVLHYPTLDSSRVRILYNICGESMTVDGSWNYVPNTNTNKIVTADLSRNPWGKDNYIYGNVLLNGTTPASVNGFSGFVYKTDLLHMTRQPVMQYTGRLTFTTRH